MSYNSGSNRALNFKSASRCALGRFWNYSPDYSLNCTPLNPITIINRGKNHIWKYFPDLASGAIFWMIIYKQQFLHSDWLKTCQLIPNQWNFTSATLNHIRFVFFFTISRITKENFAKICWQLKTPTRTWWYTRCIMQMSYLYASDFPLKNFCKIAQHKEQYEKMFGKRVMTRICCR